MLGRFTFHPDDAVDISLNEESGKWTMRAFIHGKHYSGERPTLELAFKATDRLLYEKAKEYWLKSTCHEVVKEFSSILEA